MKNILIPTDFSECANAASDYAIQLAEMTGAKVHFLHLQFTPVDWVRLPKEKEKLFPESIRAIGRAKSKLNKLHKDAKGKGVKAEKSLVFETGDEKILKHLKDHSFDFIVMGSNGAKGIYEKVVGSNAQQILRNSSVPVLIIKKPVFNPVKNILFVSDFTDVSRDSFHTLTGFADLLDANSDLLFVNIPGKFEESMESSQNMDRVMTHCNRAKSCTRNVIHAETVEEGVQFFLKNKPMDLIAICTHGKSRLRQLFSPSIAEKIANHTMLPLLSIKL